MKRIKNKLIGMMLLSLTVSCTSIENYFKAKPGENEFTLVWIDNKFSNSKEKSEIELTRVKTIVEGLKQDKNNGEIIFMSIGDIFVNNKYIPFTDFNDVEKVLDKANFDYLVLSKNDILFGKKKIESYKSNGDAKILTGNIFEGADSLGKNYDIRKISGRKVGIFSINLLNENEQRYLKTNAPNIKFIDSVITSKTIINKMKEEKVEFIIAVIDENQKFDLNSFVKDVPEIDLIINSSNKKESELNSIIGTTQVINLNSKNEESVGVVKVDLDSFNDKKFTIDYSVYGKNTILKNKNLVFEDEKLRKLFIDLELKELSNLEQLTTLDFDLQTPLEETHYGKTNFSALIFDAIKSKVNTDVICLEVENIKNDLNKGVVTEKVLEKSINSQLTLVTKEMSGENLYILIEKGLEALPKITPSTLIFSGIDFKINPSNPVGRRVVDLKIGDTNIDLSKTYTVTMPNFFSNLEYEKVKGKVVKEDGNLVKIVAEYLKNNSLDKYKK